MPTTSEAHAKRTQLLMLIGIPMGLVVICALATSTKPNEYQAFSGFVTEEHESMGLRAIMSKGAQHHLAILRGVGSALAGEKKKELAQLDENSPLTPAEVDAKAKSWAADHPEESRHLYMTTITGLIIGVLGVTFLLVSEISTVLLVRDLDMFHASGEPLPIEVEERAELWGGGLSARWRPWISLSGAGLMVAGSLVMFYPMCDVLADFGMPEAVTTADCLTSVVLMAIVGSIGWACLITSLCWTCTRPWAALLLCVVSLGAHVATSVANPFVVLLWAVSSGFLAYWYLAYIPEAEESYRPPDWRTPLYRGYRGGYPGPPPPPPPSGWGGGGGYGGYAGDYGARPGEKPSSTAYV